MRASLLSSLAAALLALPAGSAAAPAPAQADAALGPAEQGFVLSARGGFARPHGDLSGEGDPPLDAVVRSRTTAGLELGYRFDPRFWLGLFLEFAPVRVHRAYCLTSCDGESVRFGAGLQLHLAPRRRLDPWVGAGVALEFLTVEAAVDLDGDGGGDEDRELQYAGISLPLQAGLDLALSPRLRIGPYVLLSPGQYTSVRARAPDVSGVRVRIEERATHVWAEVGLRIAVLL